MKNHKVVRIVVGACMLLGGIGLAVGGNYPSAAVLGVMGVVFLLAAFKKEK